jgi:hypothetical protein
MFKLTESNYSYESSKNQNIPRSNSTGYLNIARRQGGPTISSNGKFTSARRIPTMKPKYRMKAHQNLPL